ncbi:hypothetical protein GQ457_09G008110 [Hibiscus cannabinus]
MGTNPQSKSHHPNSISSLYEVEYTEDQKIQPTTLPTVNPYLAYQKPSSSIIKSIKSLIHKAPKSVKESKEQFVTLEIPSTFPKGWIEAGYSHIHFGAIRLALNYHGAEGKPIIARIALLDTRFLKYQDACIGTVEATMNNGLVMVTLFPDFTMALVDPNLMDALKVQIHIIGAPQVESSIIATLHYQIVYRVQDHSFKLSKGGPTESPLPLITVNTQEQPHCVGIPRKISRDELIQLLPESWVTSYEQTHAARQPVRSTETKITSKSDGTSEIKFDHSHLKEQQTPPIFHTQIMMMLPRGDPTAQHDKENPKDCWCDLCHPGAESRMIEKWDAEGKPILFWKDPVTGHCPWNEDCSCEQRRQWQIRLPSRLWSEKEQRISDLRVFTRSVTSSSTTNPPIKPCYKKMYRWIEKRPQEKKWIEKKVAIQANFKPQTERICMFSTTGPSYNKDFPPLEEFTEKEYRHAAKIPSLPGEKKISAAEATLNWQTENALAQNATLKRIDARVTQMDSKITMVESKVDSNTKIAHELIVALHKNLERAEKRTIEPGQDIWSYVEQKQQEVQRLQNQIKTLQEHGLTAYIQPDRPFFPTGSTTTTQPSIFDKKYFQPPEPRKLAPYELRDLIRKQEAEQKRERDERERKGKRNEEDEPMPKVSKALMIQEQQSANPLTSFLKEYKETTIPRILALNTDEQEQSESEESSGSYESESPKSTSEGEVFMTNPGVKTEDDPMDDEASPSTTTPPIFQVNSGKQVFTIDDIPSDRWAQRFQEFQAWMDTQKLTRESNYEILTEFVSRLTGTLRDWWTSVGEADQVTFLTRQSFSEIIKLLHTIFLGNQEDVKTLKRREFFKRKCCSTERKHLQKHFTIMTKLFYILGADINLKHTILASIPEILQNAITSHLQNRGRRIEELTIGEIQQETFMAIEELCEKRKVVKDFLQGSKHISRSCRDDKFQIKCKQKEDCKCRQHKQRRFTRYSFRPPAYPKNLRRKRKWRYLKKKQPQGQKSSKCYICGKQGHFAKRCPKNRHGAKMMQEIQRKTGIQISEEDDVESIFSIDDEPTEESIFAIQSLDEVPDDSTSNSELSSSEVFMLQARVSPSDSDKLTIPTPHIPVSVYCEKYDKAIVAIAFIDTGAGKTIMNPDILPETWWKPYTKKFSTASNEIFTTYLISKPITIQFFPGCSIRTTVLGSRLPGKDILLGFDIFNQVRLLRITPRGIEYRRMFKPFVQIERLFLTQSTEEVQSLIEDLKARSCAESHEDFLSKCDHPLWQNPEFYVKLPFKKNEDINPTKASHTGMNPEHQKLAIAECSELLQQGLIEPSDSQWACEAFYVNKRSEQARGKLRLVINYQPLNHFLQDDKFPLPNRNALFSSLSKAQIFSKFDLKAGFWQLGIDPTDRPKTGFCIPNQHYQWKVMPFGLKTAPSLFQKAMIRIFQPIMDQALIYIDDILLFSQDEEAHLKLLQRFSQLLVQYGIMLSERKMKINQKEIEFLGMNLKEGKYQPGPHIAQELIKFPEKDLSKKQILQFLGIVNYLRDFIPKISKYTNPLRKMLKKDPPQWSNAQTKAVKILKDKLQQLPPLKIPSDGKRVLQTDASDKYWGAILFEEKDKKRQLCGYKSGRFTDAEIHYHSTFKEILAVKRAIAKFEYHLIGHHFLVEMDMSSFPQMLKFKQKTVPHPQLLRWSEWFSKYSFDCRHIKGKTNILADLLTRPKQSKGQIMMLRPSSSKNKVPKKKQKENPETTFDIPPNLNPEFPPEVYRLVMENKFHAKARDMIFEYQLDIFRDYGGLMLNPLGLHPDYPFIHPIHFEVEEVPDEVKWLLWYLTHIHQIAIQFVLPDLQYFVDEAIQGTEPAICRNLGTILKWFFPLPHWKDLIKQAVEQDQGHFIIIILYKPQYFIQHGNAKQLGTFPSAHVHSVQWEDIRKREDRYRALQKHLCQINRQIPKEIWPPPEKEAPWDVWPSNPKLLTPYHRSIMEAQQQYKDNIPDPSEWSQDYPWYDSNASKMTKEDDYMETEEGNDSTSTDIRLRRKCRVLQAEIRIRKRLLWLYSRWIELMQDQEDTSREDSNRRYRFYLRHSHLSSEVYQLKQELSNISMI